jgi:carbonic anhydrase
MVFYSARHLLEQFKRAMSERFKSYEEFGKLLRTSQNPSILATSAVD